MTCRTWAVIIVGMICGIASTPLQSQDQTGEQVDDAMISAIRQQELDHSEVMEYVGWLADVYGPRVTGSPGFKQAVDWALQELRKWGLSSVHEEKWPFGYGWSLIHYSASMVEPQYQPLIGYPKSWTPGTRGSVVADVVRVDIESEADFQKYHGKLAGKVALIQPARDVEMLEGIIVQRWTEPLLREAEATPLVGPKESPQPFRSSPPTMVEKIQQFFHDEGVVAELDRGNDAFMVPGDNQMSWKTQRTDGGTIFVTIGGRHDSPNGGNVVPSITLAVEHYNRMIRILDKGLPVKVELDIQTKFYDEDQKELNGINVIAEIPGSELPNEVVILGAHLDSHQAATGATDNAAGVAVMMEAMRVLRAIGAKPRRTIRIALWGGEEEGELGSHAYVAQHFVDPVAKTFKPEYRNVSAYYNLDNGTGRIRGVWLQENLAVSPIFKAWFQSLRDLGVTATIAPRSVKGSDYESFDAVGIPAFQFMQDRLEYNSRTHHSNMDTTDHVQRDDLVQMAIVVATFAYDTAMRREKLPRKTLSPLTPTSTGSQR
jgi:carboxypeptidase Q